MKRNRRTRSIVALSSSNLTTAVILAGVMGALFLAGCGADTASPENNPPVLVSLSADPEAVPSGGVCTITAKANDPDGDRLTYEWVSDLGYLAGSGSTVSFTGASCCWGGNLVWVTVKDGRGGEVRDMVTVAVGP
jgi:hypothetical protein